jgi:DNA/RNA-binding domain of Phe-tRNA-synthetase-like protein
VKYTVAQEIFEMYPGYLRGVVVAKGARNGQEERAEIVQLLRAAEEEVRAMDNLEPVSSHPRIAAWRDAYRRFGTKPAKYHSSIEAMARRVRRGDHLPYINDVAALGNTFSLRHLLPVGAHDVGQVGGDLWLARARGDEVFTPFGTDTVESPDPGEVVYIDGKTVLCRRWTWRQAEATKMTPQSSHVAVNVDGLPPVAVDEVERICEEMAGLIERFCGGDVACFYLREVSPVIEL